MEGQQVEVAFNDKDHTGGPGFISGTVNAVKRAAFAIYRGFRRVKIFRQGVIQYATAEADNLPIHIKYREEIKNAFADVVMQTQKNKIYKILVDCRDFSGKISLLDRFLLAVFLVKENSKLLARRMHPLKTSFVLSKSLIDPRRFGETVARNRGLYGLVTDNMEEALDWLEQDTPPEKES